MNKSIKKLGIIFVVVSVLVCCFAFISAAEGETVNVGVTLSETSLQPGDEVTVTVNVSTNYNAVAMRWPVLYSNAFFELTDATVTAPINTFLGADCRVDTSVSDEFVPAEYKADYKALTIQWIAGAKDGKVAAYNNPASTACFTFKLKVREDATGSGSVFVPNGGDFYTSAVESVEDVTTYYEASAQFTLGEPAVAQVKSDAPATPEIVAKDGFSVQLKTFENDETTYIIGFDAKEIVEGGKTFDTQFEVTNGGSFEAPEGFGTGKKLVLKDSSGATVATYTFILFGDVDGDGKITGDDATKIKNHVGSKSILNGCYFYAADVKPDMSNATIDGDDLAMMYNYMGANTSVSTISQLHFVG